MANTYPLTGEEVDRLDQIVYEDRMHTRMQKLVEFVEDYIENHDVDSSEVEALCKYLGTYEIVGTGQGRDLSEVFDHLSDFAEYYSDVDLPEHGGSEETIDEISMQSSESVEHQSYYALQTLYGKKLYEEYKKQN